VQKKFNHIGIELRDARIKLNLSFSDVSEDIKIQAKYLESIENRDLYELPTIGYVFGYIRSYANYLGIDGNYAVERFKSESRSTNDSKSQKSSPLVKPRSFNKYFLIIGFLALIILVLILFRPKIFSQNVILSFNSKNLEPDYIFSPSEIENFFPVYWKNNYIAYSNNGTIILEAVAPTWVQVKDINGEIIFSKVMLTSERWKGNIEEIESISVRDGGALKIKKGLQKGYILGERGEAIIDYRQFK